MQLFDTLTLDETTDPAGPPDRDTYADAVPDSVLSLWDEHGLPSLGGGRLRFVDPARYGDVLARWVTPPPGRPGRIYTPLALTGFGEVLFVRRLGSEDRFPDPACPYDLQCFDPHYRRSAFMGWDPVSALNAADFDDPNEDVFGWVPDLRRDLFDAAVDKHGPLPREHAFHFAPALAMGGTESVENVEVGDAAVHLGVLRDFVG